MKKKMVQGAGNKVGAGYWFDVKGKTKLKQFVPEQLVILSNKIEKRLAYKAGKLGITLEDIYVISPFNAVASNVAAIECPKGVSDDIFKKWQKNNVGTVHKFQGKEAKVVFFVIGSDENSEGSIDWAVSTPNLLNVAATRAKNEFYIIGNEDLFSSKQSLDVAHEIFNSSTPDYEYEKLIDYLTSDNLEAPDVLDELVQSDELNLQAIKLWQSKNKDKVRLYIHSNDFRNGQVNFDFKTGEWIGIDDIDMIDRLEKQIASGGDFKSIAGFIKKYF